MDKELTIDGLCEMLLRFVSRPRYYYGDIILKFQKGKIKNIVANDSFDMNYLNEKKLIVKDNKMFTKYGTGTKSDSTSSKIVSEVEIDENKNIIKESKIIKVNAEDKKKLNLN